MRILAIDPSSTLLGYSILESIDDKKLHVIDMATVDCEQLYREHKRIIGKQFSKLYTKLDALFYHISKITADNAIDIIVAESAFAHVFISSFAALTQVLFTLERVSHVTLNRPIIRYAPKEVKKAISGDGTAGKQSVQDAVLENSYISFDESIADKVSTATEHAFDSIAVGYTYVASQKK